MRSSKVMVVAVIGLLAMVCGCASIINTDQQKVEINSSPEGANVTIYNVDTGQRVAMGTTPKTFKLKRGGEFFKPARYKVVIEKDGCDCQEIMLEGKLDPAYLGNILLGGVIGMLIVDPATGGMWTLDPKTIDVNMVQTEDQDVESPDSQDSSRSDSDAMLVVIDISQASPEMLRNMKPLD